MYVCMHTHIAGAPFKIRAGNAFVEAIYTVW